MKITAAHDSVARSIAGLIQRMPVEAAKALTFTAERVKKAEIAELRAKLDRPTPRTVSSVYLQMATPQKLEAVVWLVDSLSGAGKGFGKLTPDRWLRPNIDGGRRALKGVEVALRRRGILNDGQWLSIAANAPKDRYGNLSAGWYQKIITAFGARFDPSQNRTTSRRSRRNTGNILMVLDEDGNPDFIAHRVGEELRPLLVVTREPKYKARVDWYGVGKRVAADVLPQKVASAIRRANGNGAAA